MIDSRAGTGTDRQQAPYTCAETITEQVEKICIEEASASGSKVTDASGQPGGQPDPAPKERSEADNTDLGLGSNEADNSEPTKTHIKVKRGAYSKSVKSGRTGGQQIAPAQDKSKENPNIDKTKYDCTKT